MRKETDLSSSEIRDDGSSVVEERKAKEDLGRLECSPGDLLGQVRLEG